MNNSFSLDQVGEFGVQHASAEDIQMEIMRHNRMRALGIHVPDSFDNSTSNNDDKQSEDELEALKYIYLDKALPEDLEQRLIDRMKNKIQSKNASYDITISEEEINQFLQ